MRVGRTGLAATETTDSRSIRVLTQWGPSVFEEMLKASEQIRVRDGQTRRWSGLCGGEPMSIRALGRFPGDSLFHSLAFPGGREIGRRALEIRCVGVDDDTVLSQRIWCDDDRHRLGEAGNSGARLYRDHGTHRFLATCRRVTAAFDSERSLAILAAHGDDPATERSAYTAFRILLHWFTARRGKCLIHAAAVGDHRGVVLITGPSGAGKSTTSLACLGTDLKFLADDYCVIDASSPPVAYAISCTARVNRASLELLAEPFSRENHQPAAFGEKRLVRVGNAYPESLMASGVVRAIAACEIAPDGRCSLQRASGASVLRALAPYTLFQSAGERTQTFSHMARLVGSCTPFRLSLGRDTARLPELVDTMLRAATE